MAAITDNVPGSDQDQVDPVVAPEDERVATRRIANARTTVPDGPARLIPADEQDL